jgi:hypothetical protein
LQERAHQGGNSVTRGGSDLAERADGGFADLRIGIVEELLEFWRRRRRARPHPPEHFNRLPPHHWILAFENAYQLRNRRFANPAEGFGGSFRLAPLVEPTEARRQFERLLE